MKHYIITRFILDENSRQGGHKAEAKNNACERQPISFLLIEVKMTSHAYCLNVACKFRFLAVPSMTCYKQTLTPGIKKYISY